ncbi:PREDICTED: putative F-box protein At1g70970 [Camelina sativa]|uniref:F-box protein At1g70970 n=1 Tax=Camelina sativa TaxID=90675 RepID=A0ABM0TKX8_CAMSA|nr:PREDICTED: putative F-box protein At1g70970 [Camelina sativa]
MEKSNFESLPEDHQMNILSRLPLKSLVKFLLVSKKWASMIRSTKFNVDYLPRSMTRPRVMFMVQRYTSQASQPPELEMLWFDTVYKEQTVLTEPPYDEVLFHSVYQDKEPLLSSGQQQLRISQPIRGLICLRLQTKLAICNPVTRMFHILPEIQAPEDSYITSFLGYDEATNVFKVLCITKSKSLPTTREYLVLTVESGQEESWRSIACLYEHDKVKLGEGICKGGVLYYGAQTDEAQSNGDKFVLMSFNVRSKDFAVIRYPEYDSIYTLWRLVFYKEKIALVNDCDFYIIPDFIGNDEPDLDNEAVNDESNGTKVFHIIVLDESTQQWETIPIEILHWEEAVGEKEFQFQGTIGENELVFAQNSTELGGPDYCVLYYNTETKCFRRFEIQGVVGNDDSVQTFLSR